MKNLVIKVYDFTGHVDEIIDYELCTLQMHYGRVNKGTSPDESVKCMPSESA